MNTEDDLHSISPSPLSAGRQLSFPNFGKWGIEKENECLGGLKEFLLQLFAWEDFLCSLCQKGHCKIKYGSKGSISNVNHGLFYANNQLISDISSEILITQMLYRCPNSAQPLLGCDLLGDGSVSTLTLCFGWENSVFFKANFLVICIIFIAFDDILKKDKEVLHIIRSFFKHFLLSVNCVKETQLKLSFKNLIYD